jgi:hypothetical protein
MENRVKKLSHPGTQVDEEENPIMPIWMGGGDTRPSMSLKLKKWMRIVLKPHLFG